MQINSAASSASRSCLPLAIALGTLPAQSDRGTTTGDVTDQEGPNFPGANVKAPQTSTKVKFNRTTVARVRSAGRRSVAGRRGWGRG